MLASQMSSRYRTAIALPIEVVTWIAITFVLEAEAFVGWTVSERVVVICDVVEKVDLLLFQHQRGSQRVNWCITPALVKEATSSIQGLEIIDVLLGPEPVQVAYLKIRPLVFLMLLPNRRRL
jgi:hypothetical protein